MNEEKELKLKTDYFGFKVNVSGISFASVILAGIVIAIALLSLGGEVKVGLSRNAAINQHLTTQEYMDWVNAVDKLNP